MARHHLIEHHPEGPPVYTGAVGLVVNDLRGDVLRSAAEGCGGGGPGYSNLAIILSKWIQFSTKSGGSPWKIFLYLFKIHFVVHQGCKKCFLSFIQLFSLKNELWTIKKSYKGYEVFLSSSYFSTRRCENKSSSQNYSQLSYFEKKFKKEGPNDILRLMFFWIQFENVPCTDQSLLSWRDPPYRAWRCPAWGPCKWLRAGGGTWPRCWSRPHRI